VPPQAALKNHHPTRVSDFQTSYPLHQVRYELDEAEHQYIIHARALIEALTSAQVITLSGFALYHCLSDRIDSNLFFDLSRISERGLSGQNRIDRIVC